MKKIMDEELLELKEMYEISDYKFNDLCQIFEEIEFVEKNLMPQEIYNIFECVCGYLQPFLVNQVRSSVPMIEAIKLALYKELCACEDREYESLSYVDDVAEELRMINKKVN